MSASYTSPIERALRQSQAQTGRERPSTSNFFQGQAPVSKLFQFVNEKKRSRQQCHHVLIRTEVHIAWLGVPAYDCRSRSAYAARLPIILQKLAEIAGARPIVRTNS